VSSAVIFVDKKTPVTFFFDNDNTYNLERAQKAFHSDTQRKFRFKRLVEFSLCHRRCGPKPETFS
jgi:hypothetical protein